jgi:hypothetical protein
MVCATGFCARTTSWPTCRRAFQILDTQDQLSAIKRLMKQFNIDDERFPPKQTNGSSVAARRTACGPTWSKCAMRRPPQEDRDLPALRRPVPARRCGRLRRADAAQLRGAARQRPDPRALPAPLPAHPDRRIPGHQQAAICLDQDAGRADWRARRPRRKKPVSTPPAACWLWGTTTRASMLFAALGSATWLTSCASSA